MRNVSRTITKQVYFLREIWILMESRRFSSWTENNGENPAIIALHTEIYVIVYGTLKARKHVHLSLSLSSNYLDALR